VPAARPAAVNIVSRADGLFFPFRTTGPPRWCAGLSRTRLYAPALARLCPDRPSTSPSASRRRSCRGCVAGDLALELGEGQQYIEGQPTHRARRVELLGHRDERHALGPSRSESVANLFSLGLGPAQRTLPMSRIPSSLVAWGPGGWEARFAAGGIR
jgi:hypothetical protein